MICEVEFTKVTSPDRPWIEVDSQDDVGELRI